MQETPQISLTYDGTHPYVDGVRAYQRIGTSNGAVLLTTSDGTIAVSQADYDRAKRDGAATVAPISLDAALDGIAVWTEGVIDTTPSA